MITASVMKELKNLYSSLIKFFLNSDSAWFIVYDILQHKIMILTHCIFLITCKSWITYFLEFAPWKPISSLTFDEGCLIGGGTYSQIDRKDNKDF